MTDAVTVTSRAKINLALSVGSPLPDTGMHPLASWMTLVNFGDTIEITRLADDAASRLNRVPDDASDADDALPPVVIDWPLEKDLAFRAHALLEAHVGRSLPVDVNIVKRIPVGAGLGGGSGNAAVMLVSLRDLFALDVSDDALIRLGATLGSDVAFMVRAALGAPACLVTGLGETIEPMPVRELIPLVLIFPPFGCATGAVYGAFDARLAHTGVDQSPDEARVRALAEQSPVPQDAPFNDLAEPACDVQPELRSLRDSLTQSLGLPVHITGSGSTMFVIAPSALTSKVLARKVTAVSDLPAIATRSA